MEMQRDPSTETGVETPAAKLEPMPEVEAAFEEIEVDAPLVGIIMGSKNGSQAGLRVIIAGAGMSAALPGVAAAHTDLPVIGVPIMGKSLGGLDALLSAVQMPPGVPVGCVAIDGAKNAGLLAARIINA